MSSFLQRTAAVVRGVVSGKPPRARYQALLNSQVVDEEESGTGSGIEDVTRHRFDTSRFCAIFLVVSGVIFTFFGIIYLSLVNPSHTPKSCDEIDAGYQCTPKISHLWGQYSPYFSVPSTISPDTPAKCEVTFVQILSRHGARAPTADKSAAYHSLIKHIHKKAKHFRGKFSFIKDYEYTLGADQLSEFGAQELVNSGDKFYRRYADLAPTNWTKGFHIARTADPEVDDRDESYPYDILVLNEGPKWNNTLNHGRCSSIEDGYYSQTGHEAQETWTEIFTKKIRKHVNKHLPGVKLSARDIIHLMDLCPFETVASPSGDMSEFCALFSHKEWKGYDYYQSLGKYYGFGWGNPLGATQGVGFTNELIARLTNSPVNDRTSTNSTLDGNEDTFPTSPQMTLFADFSHDNDMTAIFAAMGLFNETEKLSNETRRSVIDMKGYSAAWTVPFAGRAYFEKMKCEDASDELVRVLVNDRVLPLKTCGGDELGRCTLSLFVDSLEFARNGGHWDQCFV